MQLGRDWYARIFWNQANRVATRMIDMERTYTLLGRDWYARLFWNQAHTATTTMIDMKRSYILVYAIRRD